LGCEERGELEEGWGIGQVFISSLTPDSSSKSPLLSKVAPRGVQLTSPSSSLLRSRLLFTQPLWETLPTQGEVFTHWPGQSPSWVGCGSRGSRMGRAQSVDPCAWASKLRALRGREWAGGTWWVDTNADLVLVDKATAPCLLPPQLPVPSPGGNAGRSRFRLGSRPVSFLLPHHPYRASQRHASAAAKLKAPASSFGMGFLGRHLAEPGGGCMRPARVASRSPVTRQLSLAGGICGWWRLGVAFR
jgi:hypothetical protein